MAEYKEVRNGNGTNLTIGEGRYIAVGKGGSNITIRGAGKVICFDRWDDLVRAVDVSRSVYACDDEKGLLKQDR